jgi:acetyl-CoA synthetase (ADP-forming)
MKPKEIFETVKKEGRKNLSLAEAIEVLKYYKIPFVRGKIVNNIKDAITYAKKIGFPVVLKIVSKDIVHKTDVGGLILNINNEEELKDSFLRLLNNVRSKVPKAKIDGVLIQQMVNGYEVLIGGILDEQFGSCISFAMGGIFVEVYSDVSYRVVPITKRDAEEMIKETKAYKILSGFRNKPKADIKALIGILLKTSKILEENPEIKELDINPIFALSKGALAADARIILK